MMVGSSNDPFKEILTLEEVVREAAIAILFSEAKSTEVDIGISYYCAQTSTATLKITYKKDDQIVKQGADTEHTFPEDTAEEKKKIYGIVNDSLNEIEKNLQLMGIHGNKLIDSKDKPTKANYTLLASKTTFKIYTREQVAEILEIDEGKLDSPTLSSLLGQSNKYTLKGIAAILAKTDGLDNNKSRELAYDKVLSYETGLAEKKVTC